MMLLSSFLHFFRYLYWKTKGTKW